MQDWIRPLHAYKRYYEQQSLTDCWEWLGTINSDGYGTLASTGAHRLAVMEWGDCDGFVQLHEGLEVHHKCGRRSCFNPQHLKALTKTEHRQLHAELRLQGV